MSQKVSLRFNKPKLFSATFNRSVTDYGSYVVKKSLTDIADTNIESTSSFRYSPLGVGLNSTQQIPLDYSKFENCAFFSSAEVLTNIAFDKIINTFPFDGTKKELEAFLDSLTGFEKYVYDRFPKNKGFLIFSGTQLSETQSTKGTYLKVADFGGGKFPTLSKNIKGNSIIDPEMKTFAIEMMLFVPAQTNDTQIVVQKAGIKTTRVATGGKSQGITLALSESTSTSNCKLVFGAVSSSLFLTASTIIEKGKFNHIYAEFNRNPGINRLGLFVNEKLVATSSNVAEFGLMDFKTEPLLIGSGTAQNNLGFNTTLRFIPKQTLSGAIDEFRIFHGVRSIDQQKQFAKKSIFASPDLKLYYKFNEPQGTIGNNAVALDSSGNSLHAEISNFITANRVTSSIANPMTYEKIIYSPILFPVYSDVSDLNSDLLASASLYDDENPNLITKLVPKHYFQEGQIYNGFSNEEGTIVDAYGGNGIPGSGELGSAQLFSSLLYVWAKFFDELKIVIDHFSNILNVDYDIDSTSSDQFLPFVAKYYGFEMPGFFSDATVEQFIDAENISNDVGTNTLSLQYIQNQIWRRILTNLGEVIRSKGTLHSIKSLMRAIGINPDANFRIREYGGPNKKGLAESRQKKTEVSTMMDFSGSFANVSGALTSMGHPNFRPFIKSQFLSGSRIEIGFPDPQGSLIRSDLFPIHGISNNVEDGLFTSGSWSCEAIYKFPNLITGSYPVTQSLMRINVSGTSAPSNKGAVLANLVAISGSSSGSVKLFARPGSNTSTSSPVLEMELTGVNIFDGNKWSVSFGRERNDSVNLKSAVSSSYFLRCARSNLGDIKEIITTSSFFIEDAFNTITNNMLQNMSAFNTSGSFITIGTQSIETSTNRFLNGIDSNREARETDFAGKVGHIRFWSKALSIDEWKEHTRNYKSLGVENPLKNFNFDTQVSGAFERLRMDVTTDQVVTQSNSLGEIQLFDYSQNNIIFDGMGFEVSKSVIKPETFNYGIISPKFDEFMNDNKVRVRGFQELKNVEEYGGQLGSVYEIDKNEEPMDDTRFSIDLSLVDALDEDMINIFAVLDKLDNILGDPELAFSGDYPELENLRKIYFNRLTEKMNIKNFFSFFKWFDGFIGIGTLIERLIPRKTKFFGMNFVIESHILERSKIEYRFYDQYLKKKNIEMPKDFSSLLKKY